eukprot:357634-Chlamydomonas_euryale.AAC.2
MLQRLGRTRSGGVHDVLATGPALEPAHVVPCATPAALLAHGAPPSAVGLPVRTHAAGAGAGGSAITKATGCRPALLSGNASAMSEPGPLGLLCAVLGGKAEAVLIAPGIAPELLASLPAAAASCSMSRMC